MISSKLAAFRELRKRLELVRDTYGLEREAGQGRVSAGLAALRAAVAKDRDGARGQDDIRARLARVVDRSPARLLEAALRMRPDRIILGELRGGECKTFLDAINTGHSGSFTTIYANTARKAIDRLALMVMSIGINMNFEEVRRY